MKVYTWEETKRRRKIHDLNRLVATWGPLFDFDEWDFMDLSDAAEHTRIASQLQDLVDRLPVGVLMLIHSERLFEPGTVRYALEITDGYE